MTPFEQMQALRAIDANANRATEALRVVEDYARFAVNDPNLSASLKQLRHELATSLGEIPDRLRLEARDTPRDVGTEIGVATEYERGSLSDVATANLKRAEQALRSLEEFCKAIWPDAARNFERLRYRLYSVGKLVRPRSQRLERLHSAQLYVLCSALDDASEFERRVRALVDAKVDVLQLRDKRLADRQLLQRAKLLRAITADSNTLFIMNDRADLACLSDADGVHVGQDELELQDARMLVGPDRLIGVSTHSPEQALEAERAGADYVGCGPVFPSETKSFAATELRGDKLLRAISANIRIPAFAIGGVTAENLSGVLAAGFWRVAVQNAVWQADDPARAARQLRAALAKADERG